MIRTESAAKTHSEQMILNNCREMLFLKQHRVRDALAKSGLNKLEAGVGIDGPASRQSVRRDLTRQVMRLVNGRRRH